MTLPKATGPTILKYVDGHLLEIEAQIADLIGQRTALWNMRTFITARGIDSTEGTTDEETR